jgi:putative transposase
MLSLRDGGGLIFTCWLKINHPLPSVKKVFQVPLGPRPAGQVCRTLGIAEQTFSRWRREHGGLKVEQAKRLKALEQENTRLRRAVADLTLDKLILQEAVRGNF